MPRADAKDDSASKVQRPQGPMRARGMKLVRIWVLDPEATGFREEAHRQASLLKRSPDELETLSFIEAVADLQGWK